MDELRHHAQGLLDRPPVEPRPLPEVRAQAERLGRVRRRRQRFAAAALALVVVAAAVAIELGRPSSPTVRAVVPTTAPSASSTAPSTALTPTTAAAGGSAGQLPPVVAFADDATGWLAEGGSCSGSTCADPVLRRTTDGGRTWTAVATVPALHQVSFTHQDVYNWGALVVLHFADPRDGWYGQGGQLWSTHDGGRTWHRLALSSVVAVTSTGETAWAWGMSGRCADEATSTTVGASTPCATALLFTAAAFDNWNPVPRSPSFAVGGDLLADAGTLWALNAGHLYTTAPGQTLTETQAPCAGRAGLGPVRLLDLGVDDVGVLCAAGAVDGNTNTMAKAVVHSTDRGYLWRTWADAPAAGWAGWAAGNGAGTALVVTDGHTLWRSAGSSWSPVFAPASATGEIDQLLMVDATVGFVVSDDGHGQTTVLTTTDGARTWTPIPGL